MKEKYYFDVFPELTSERLLLKEIRLSEANQMIEITAYDGQQAENNRDVVRILSQIALDYFNGDGITWGLYLKSTGEFIGNCCFCRGYQNNIAEIGYVLKADFRGHGYMTEAVKTVTRFGLQDMKVKQVCAYTAPDNRASQSVLLTAGFTTASCNQDSHQFICQ